MKTVNVTKEDLEMMARLLDLPLDPETEEDTRALVERFFNDVNAVREEMQKEEYIDLFPLIRVTQ